MILHPVIIQEAPSLPEARVGENYQYQFQTEGGLAPLMWSVLRGSLPPGMTLEPSGRLRGAPLQAQREPYRFVIEVSDSAQTPQRFSQEFQLVVNAAPLRIVVNQPQLRIVIPTTLQPANTPATSVASGHITAQLTGTEDGGGSKSGGLANNSAESSVVSSEAKPRSRNEGVNVEAASRTATRTGSTVSVAGMPATTPMPVTTPKVCGRVRPASLNQILALLVAVIDDPDLPPNANEKIKSQMEEVKKSRLLDEVGCGEDTDFKRGNQRKALISLMKFLQIALSGDKNQTEQKDKLHSEAAKQEVRKVVTSQRNLKFPSLSLEMVQKQVELLSSYIGNVPIHVRGKGDKLIATAFTDSDGYYIVHVPQTAGSGSEKAEYTVATEEDGGHTKKTFVLNDVQDSVRLDLDIEERPVSLLTRAVVGYQQSGAAASEFEQNYFFDFFVSASVPTHQKIDPDFGERWRAWGAVRSASLPQTGEATVGDLSVSFAQQAGSLKVRDVARVFDFLAGAEYRLMGNTALLPSFDRDTKQKFSLSLIASFGVQTPTDPTQLPTVFKLAQPIRDLFPAETSGKEFFAFVRPDRDRFFRQYYAGFRVQGFFFNRYNIPLQRFPAQLDVTFGQNEYVTGGRVRGGLFRLDGYYPLPFSPLQFINLYGTAVLKPARTQIKNGLILEPTTGAGAPTVTDPRVALISVPQFNRDYYKVGVGIDFIAFTQALLRWKQGSGN